MERRGRKRNKRSGKNYKEIRLTVKERKIMRRREEKEEDKECVY